MKETPHVLILSNECLRENGANGRTLRNFLLGWPRECLAQFYTEPETPDFSFCSGYYRVTDADVLRSGRKPRSVQGRVVPAMEQEVPKKKDLRQKYGKNPLTLLVRTLLWNMGLWISEDFKSWLTAFHPEVILLQAGDSPFMFALAEKIAGWFNAKLVIYNSESYYFKAYDYTRSSGLAHLFYPLFHRYYRHQFRRTLQRTGHMIVSCEALQKRYAAEFDIPITTLYTVSEWTAFPIRKTDGFSAVYAGNLGVGRVVPLTEIADALQEISAALHLDVYGKAPTPAEEQTLKAHPGIRYHGPVPYDVVKKAAENSDLLVHAENFDAFYEEDLRYAFSTKIADALAGGRPFLLYAPRNMACSVYLRQNRAAWSASDKKELREHLKKLVLDGEARLRFREAALALAERNHRAEINGKRFQQILRQV